MTVYERLKQLITDPEISLVSFEAFGILLTDSTIHPDDLLFLIEKKAQLAFKDPSFPFARIRIWAEKICKSDKSLRDEDENCITLDDIYDKLRTQLKISPAKINRLKKLEILTREKLLKQRHHAYELYDLCVEMKKTIVICQDTCLPNTMIEKALNDAGFVNFHSIYSSSDGKYSKANGTLYSQILVDFKVQSSEMLHIGHDQNSDVIQPKKQGIKTFLWVTPFEQYLSREMTDPGIWFNKLDHLEPSMRLILGFIINHEFAQINGKKWNNSSLFNGDPHLLGYYGFGPVLLSMISWMINGVKIEQIDHIGFAGRDGFLPFKIYEQVRKIYKDLPLATFFPISRKVCFPIQYVSKAEALTQMNEINFTQEATAGEFLEQRFFIKRSKAVDSHFATFGINLDNSIVDPDRFFEAFAGLNESEFIKTERQRKLIKSFYSKIFSTANRLAVFDIGYTGRVQRILSSMLKKDVVGFYFLSFIDVLDLPSKGLQCYNYSAVPHNKFVDPPAFSTAILELVFSKSDSGSLSSFSENNNEVCPEFNPVEFDEASIETIKQIQHGVLSFSNSFLDYIGDDFQYLLISPPTAGRVLNYFMQKPYLADAQIISSLNFSDQVTGEHSHSVIGKNLSSSYWKQGYSLLQYPVLRTFALNRKRPGYLGWRKYLVPIVRPFIRKLGTNENLRKFDEDPSSFFNSLHEPYFKFVGQLFFPYRSDR